MYNYISPTCVHTWHGHALYESLLLGLVLLPRGLAVLLTQFLVDLVLQERVVLVVSHDVVLLTHQHLSQHTVLKQGMVHRVKKNKMIKKQIFNFFLT